jgi:Arabinose-binding domain of AraC transcription regulator, N-term
LLLLASQVARLGVVEFCMFAALRICRVLTGQNLVPQHFSFSHYRSEGTSEMARFIGTKVEFGADTDEFFF